jgi:hypothetical protein
LQFQDQSPKIRNSADALTPIFSKTAEGNFNAEIHKPVMKVVTTVNEEWMPENVAQR